MEINNDVYLSLGTNLGDRFINLQDAINTINNKIGAILKISSIYKTPSWGFNGNDFYNICIKISTFLDAYTLIDSLLKIETELGRQRTAKIGYENRNIDIDILLYNNDIIKTEKLIVPHQKMLDRKFVLIPLLEIAPTIYHPVENKTISTCLKNCRDTSEIEKINKHLTKPI